MHDWAQVFEHPVEAIFCVSGAFPASANHIWTLDQSLQNEWVCENVSEDKCRHCFILVNITLRGYSSYSNIAQNPEIPACELRPCLWLKVTLEFSLT